MPDLRWRAAAAGLSAVVTLIGSMPLFASRPTGAADLLARILAPLTPALRHALPWLFALPAPSLGAGLFVLSLPTVLWAGQPLFAGAWQSVQRRRVNADLLVALAVSLAMIASSLAALAPGLLASVGLSADVSFEVVTAVVALALVARMLDRRALTRIAGIAGAAPAGGAPAPRSGERAGAVLPAVVLALAVAVFVLWSVAGPANAALLGLVASVAVLVIASPVALGFAAPSAIRVGAGHGARRGVLVRSGEVLLAAAALDVVVLDKTGTVTDGKPVVIEIITAGKAGGASSGVAPMSEEGVLRYAAAVERYADHPLAAAIVREAGSRELTPPDAEDFEARPGRGALARVEGHQVAVGSAAFLIELGVDIGPFTEAVDTLAAKARTPVLVAVDDVPVGLLGLADRIKPSAVGAVRQLKKMGLSVVLVTADMRKAAIAVAGEIGVDAVESGLLPSGKVAVIRRLQQAGRRVAMIGDGTQDAAALAAADVGIAIGADAADVPAADVALTSSDLKVAVTALELARRTRRTVRQNLCWAFAYHALGIPVAAGILYPLLGVLVSPLMASAAMVLSSTAVFANSSRLDRFTPTFTT